MKTIDTKIWKKINDKYFISEYGEVMNIKRGNILKPYISKKGYERVDVDGRKNVMIHHLVYEMFIGKRNKNLVIDHIDGNKRNNHYTNLQQISSKQNTQKGNRCTHILVIDKFGNKIYFPSICELCKYLDYNNGKGTNVVFNSKKFKKHFKSYEEVSSHTYEN